MQKLWSKRCGKISTRSPGGSTAGWGGSTANSRAFPVARAVGGGSSESSTAGETRATGSTAGSTGTTAGTQKISDLRSERDFARFWAEKGDGKSQIERGNDGIKPWERKGR